MIKKTIKILGWTLLVAVVLILLAVSVVVWYMSPERLTPLIEREVSARIDGSLEVRKAELTFWSSFPRLEVDIDTLAVISRSMHTLDSAARAEIPAYADSLFSVDKIHGAVNLLSLVQSKIELYDIRIERPRANVVIGRDGAANFNIFPVDNEQQDTTSTQGTLPDISIDRFRIIDAGPLTFTSIPDSLYLSLVLANTELSGSEEPAYKFEFSGNASSPLLSDFALDPFVVALNGKVDWSPSAPAAVALRNFDIQLNEFEVAVDAEVDATEALTVRKCDIDLKRCNIADVVAHLPLELRQRFATLDTDMDFNAAVSLTQPYVMGDSVTIPSFDARVTIEPCRFYWGNIKMDRVCLRVDANVDGDNLDDSKVDIKQLELKGRALDVYAEAKVDGPLVNPYIDGRIRAALRFNRLPRELLDRLPMTLTGSIAANTGVRMHAGDFTPANFHNIYLDGNISLSDADMLTRDSLVAAYVSKAKLDFGTSRRLKDDADANVDSLLTLTLDIDSASVKVPGLDLKGTGLKAALGAMNRNSSSDTTRINPFGGMISMKSFIIEQPMDTMTVRLRDFETTAVLSRFKGLERNPEMRFDMHARRISTRMPDINMVLSQPSIGINAHLIPRGTVHRDSTRMAQQRRRNMARRDTLNHDDVIDWNVSNDLKTLLRRWDIDGSLVSERAFIFMRSFPLRQRAADIDLHFNTDTVSLNSLKYSIGNTKFEVKGDITNIERALTSRTKRAKLRINFDINSSFIDVNELAATTFYETSGNAGPDPDYDEDVAYEAPSATVDSTAPRALLVPSNIEANLSIRADSIKYSDLIMKRFSGDVLVNNSAINLSNLNASTDIGSATLSALYWAPDTANMQFGMGMKLNRFHIDRVLSLIPAVDSLLPALQGFAGVINADLAATANITPAMDIDFASFKGALKLDGDSLVLLDADTFKMLAKWLIFKNKKRNMIDHMDVEIVVDDSQVQIYPFIFDIDRYKLGVMGRNDLDMNLDYHVSVLKSPLPFKFGINIKGNLDDPKIRLGGAKIKPGQANTYAIADTTRINLLSQIQDVFRRGAMSKETMGLKTPRRIDTEMPEADTLTANDSLLMQREGFLPADTVPAPEPAKKRKFPWTKK